MRAEMGKDPTRAPQSQLNLPPGFRFYPTDEELVVHYLCKKAACEPFSVPIIAEVELYKFDPWDLPEKALFGEKEWYFFSPRDRKYPNGSRPNRAAGSGYWKATGTDKPISTMGGSKKVGVKKALVFYKGKAPKGMKTNWIMHEYRLADSGGARSAKRKAAGGSLRLDDWVLCRIYKKCSAAANNNQKPAKERSEANSCLDDVLASLPEIDRVNPLKGLEMGSNDTYKDSHYSPDMSGLMEQQQEDVKVPLHQLCSNLIQHHLLPRPYRHSIYSDDPSTTQCEPDSSLEVSNERQHSPTESTLEEDSVESTFNTLPSFMGGGGGGAMASAGATPGGGTGGPYYINTSLAAQQQSMFSFDGLPSPFGTTTGGFPPLQLGDGDYLNFNSADFATFMQRSIC